MGEHRQHMSFAASYKSAHYPANLIATKNVEVNLRVTNACDLRLYFSAIGVRLVTGQHMHNVNTCTEALRKTDKEIEFLRQIRHISRVNDLIQLEDCTLRNGNHRHAA